MDIALNGNNTLSSFKINSKNTSDYYYYFPLCLENFFF